MMTSSADAIAQARARLSRRQVRDARQLCLAYHDMGYQGMLNGLACILDHMRVSCPAAVVNDFTDVVRDEWERLAARGQRGSFEYAKGYSVGRWGHEMELNPNGVWDVMYDHWNDGWRRGHEDLNEMLGDPYDD